MRLRVVTLFFSCSAIAAVWACSLNPQPLPPDGYDGSAADTGIMSSPDAGGGTDGGDIDGSVPQGGDAGTDGSSGDASFGDAGDAAEDARDDGPSDAGEDG